MQTFRLTFVGPGIINTSAKGAIITLVYITFLMQGREQDYNYYFLRLFVKPTRLYFTIEKMCLLERFFL